MEHVEVLNLKAVLVESGLVDITDVWGMDESQIQNVSEMIKDEIHSAGRSILDTNRLDRWIHCHEFLTKWIAAARELELIKASPTMIVHNGTNTLWCFKLWEVWAPGRPTSVSDTGFHLTNPDLEDFMETYIMVNDREWREQMGDSPTIKWQVMDDPLINGEIQLDNGEPAVIHNYGIDANGMLGDYGLWLGHSLVSKPTNNHLTLADVAPMAYVEEFMEMAFQPRQEVVQEFLLKFYAAFEVEEWMEKIAWDNEAHD